MAARYCPPSILIAGLPDASTKQTQFAGVGAGRWGYCYQWPEQGVTGERPRHTTPQDLTAADPELAGMWADPWWKLAAILQPSRFVTARLQPTVPDMLSTMRPRNRPRSTPSDTPPRTFNP